MNTLRREVGALGWILRTVTFGLVAAAVYKELQLPAEHLAELDEVSRIELGFPYELLMGPQGQLVYGDLEPRIELPAAAPIRWR